MDHKNFIKRIDDKSEILSIHELCRVRDTVQYSTLQLSCSHEQCSTAEPSAAASAAFSRAPAFASRRVRDAHVLLELYSTTPTLLVQL